MKPKNFPTQKRIRREKALERLQEWESYYSKLINEGNWRASDKESLKRILAEIEKLREILSRPTRYFTKILTANASQARLNRRKIIR